MVLTLTRSLVEGVSRELQEGQPRSVQDDLVSPDRRGRREAGRSACRHEVVLFHAVPAHAEPADQLPVPVERDAAGEKDDSTLIRVRGLASLLTGDSDIV